MQHHLDLIQSPATLEKLVAILKKGDCIAVDTEFVREKTYLPQLALIQIANRTDTWLVDPLALDKKQMEPLLELLQNEKILKVLHSAYGDQKCFYASYQITATPTFDTFEAASLLGYGESVGLRDIVKRMMEVHLPKFLTRTDWLRRPIHNEMKLYAMADVEFLLPIHDKMLTGLENLNRKEWAFELSAVMENPNLYSENPEGLAQKIAYNGRVSANKFPKFRKLVAWREARARSLNIPRKRIADDETLINIVNSQPQSVQELGRFRGLNPGEIRKEGEKILEILRINPSPEEEALPKPQKVLRPTAQQSRVIDFLSTYLKAVCLEKKIASRLIMTVKDITKMVVENIEEPEAWVSEGICSQRARDLVAESFSAVLQGRRALAIKAGKLDILEI